MSEALFVKQSQWAKDGKIEPVVAEVLTPDEMAKVKQFLKDPSLDQSIDQDLAIASERKVRATTDVFSLRQRAGGEGGRKSFLSRFERSPGPVIEMIRMNPRLLHWACRIFLAGIFIYAGYTKIETPCSSPLRPKNINYYPLIQLSGW